MKQLNFDHSKNTILEAMGCEKSTNQISKEIADLVEAFMTDESKKSNSHLVEMMHESLDYETILLLAMDSLESKIEKYEALIMLKEILSDDE